MLNVVPGKFLDEVLCVDKFSGQLGLSCVSCYQETFKLLLSDVNNSSSVPQWRETDYSQYDVIAADHVFTDVNNATINDHTSSFAVTQQGAWLAFRDQVYAVNYTKRTEHFTKLYIADISPDRNVHCSEFDRIGAN